MGLFGGGCSGGSDTWIWIAIIIVLVLLCSDGNIFGGKDDKRCCEPCEPRCCPPPKDCCDPCC